MKHRWISQKEAFAFVSKHHRHHKKPAGSIVCIGCYEADKLLGVAVVGRPVARMLDNGSTAEITRLCVDGTPNAASFLLTKAARVAQAMGFARVITYTLSTESGSSLFGAGWIDEGPAGGGSWSRGSRLRTDPNPTCVKRRWSKP